MPVVHRYLIRQFLMYFAIVQTAVICIFVSVDYLSRLDSFLEAGMGLFRGFVFVALKIPFMVVQLTPVCSILCALILFGMMNRHNEVTALKSGGASLYWLLQPILLTGIVFSVFLFVMAEGVVPVTKAAANRIKRVEIKKRKMVTTSDTNIWLRGSRSITHIKHYDGTTKAIMGITVSYFDDGFNLVRRIDAAAGHFFGEEWTLTGGIEQVLDDKTGSYTVNPFKKKIERIEISPDDLKSVVKQSEEMSILELYRHVRKVEFEGYDATSYRVDLYAKTAFPFVCIIMIMLGTGISVRGKVRGGGLSVSVAYGIGVAFLYWVFHSFCISLGYGEMLPAFAAAWAANFIFTAAAAVILINAEWS